VKIRPRAVARVDVALSERAAFGMSARPTVIVAGILLVVRWLWSRNKRKGS